MKKIIAIALAVLLIMAMAVPAYAVTPKYEFTALPEIPDISDDIKIEIDIPDSFWDKWFQEHPIKLHGEENTDAQDDMTRLLKKWAGMITAPTYKIPGEELIERLKGVLD